MIKKVLTVLLMLVVVFFGYFFILGVVAGLDWLIVQILGRSPTILNVWLVALAVYMILAFYKVGKN